MGKEIWIIIATKKGNTSLLREKEKRSEMAMHVDTSNSRHVRLASATALTESTTITAMIKKDYYTIESCRPKVSEIGGNKRQTNNLTL